jgi:hypothetical protein
MHHAREATLAAPKIPEANRSADGYSARASVPFVRPVWTIWPEGRREGITKGSLLVVPDTAFRKCADRHRYNSLAVSLKKAWIC